MIIDSRLYWAYAHNIKITKYCLYTISAFIKGYRQKELTMNSLLNSYA